MNMSCEISKDLLPQMCIRDSRKIEQACQYGCCTAAFLLPSLGIL